MTQELSIRFGLHLFASIFCSSAARPEKVSITRKADIFTAPSLSQTPCPKLHPGITKQASRLLVRFCSISKSASPFSRGSGIPGRMLDLLSRLQKVKCLHLLARLLAKLMESQGLDVEILDRDPGPTTVAARLHGLRIREVNTVERLEFVVNARQCDDEWPETSGWRRPGRA
jgi:hypothetical protein